MEINRRLQPVKDRDILRYVNPGYSYLSSSDARVHIGLGKDTSIDSISFAWVDGVMESFSIEAINKYITIAKGQGRTINKWLYHKKVK